MRRSLAVLASIGLGIGTIALASPVQATTVGVALVGNGESPPTALVFESEGSQVDSIAATEINIFNYFTSVAQVTSNALLDDGNSCQSTCEVTEKAETLGMKTFTVAPSANNAFVVISVVAGGETLIGNLTVTYNGSGGGDDSGSSAPAGSAPASELQQFGLPASGNCEDGVTEAMNWSGVGMDGWGISWAQWANDGAGGAVCTRTVVYDTSTAKWVVN